MSEDRGGSGRPRQRRPWRAGALAVAVTATTVLATTVLAAACGGGGSPTAAPSENYQKALAFVQCMRTRGESAFPDPTSQGIVSDSQANVRSPQLLAAYRTCQTLLPPGDLQLSAAQQEELTATALKMADCMRAHGVLTFPDPPAPGAKPQHPAGPGIDPGSPVFQAAARACNLHVSAHVSIHAGAHVGVNIGVSGSAPGRGQSG
jgi:hypothetical protein